MQAALFIHQSKKEPMNHIYLPSRLCPPASYYAAIASAGRVTIDSGERLDKRCKDAHRYTIADTHGRLGLTVPVAKPYAATWQEAAVSTHGQWWLQHFTALESAYGRTPYFEFYADDFRPLFLPDRFTTVGRMNADFDAVIRRCLGITTPVELAPKPADEPYFGHSALTVAPYWQVRADSLGFIGGLSVLDLLFNMGPESLPILLQAGKTF